MKQLEGRILLTIQLLLALLQILHQKRFPRGNTALWSVKHFFFWPNKTLNCALVQSPPSETSPLPSLLGLPPERSDTRDGQVPQSQIKDSESTFAESLVSDCSVHIYVSYIQYMHIYICVCVLQTEKKLRRNYETHRGYYTIQILLMLISPAKKSSIASPAALSTSCP